MGEGAPIEEVIEQSKISNTNKIITKMLESGDIFQLSPGRVKLL